MSMQKSVKDFRGSPGKKHQQTKQMTGFWFRWRQDSGLRCQKRLNRTHQLCCNITSAAHTWWLWKALVEVIYRIYCTRHFLHVPNNPGLSKFETKLLGIVTELFFKISATFSSCCLPSCRRQSLTSLHAASSLRSLSSAWSKDGAALPPAIAHEAFHANPVENVEIFGNNSETCPSGI